MTITKKEKEQLTEQMDCVVHAFADLMVELTDLFCMIGVNPYGDDADQKTEEQEEFEPVYPEAWR